MRTVIHVTHEAVQKVGGIGAVLQGLITSPDYQREVQRTLLVGPLLASDQEDRIAREGAILYSSISGVRGGDTGKALDRVAQKYDVNLVYGRRKLVHPTTGIAAEPEVLLVDPAYMSPRLENNFKVNLYRRFGLQSDRYEGSPDYLLYLRIAEPAYEAAAALLGDAPGPHFVLAHEYMGMPTALKAVLAGDARYRTVFYAHEVAPMRMLVEGSPGHDTMFYNVMAQALDAGLSLSDVFGDQSGFYRHALVERSHLCDTIFAVGDYVLQELRFLGPALRDRQIDLVYNGIPAVEISLEEKRASGELLRRYAENLLGMRPDVIFTHVTRLVVSKGLWRDLRVLEHLDGILAAGGKRGVLFVLSTVAGPRSPSDVARMEADYGWPVDHLPGPPDLVGPEVEFWAAVLDFNRGARAVRVVFVNQFGWDRENCGARMPEEMDFMDLRKGTDVEFGQSIYEPFGIAQVEPLGFGALCVVSSVCGCRGFAASAAEGAEAPNLIVADYVTLPGAMALDDLRHIGLSERSRIEAERSREVAEEILRRLPASDAQRAEAIRQGRRVAGNMSWNRVCTDLLLPGLDRAAKRKR